MYMPVKDIVEIRDKHPDAEMIIHPECGCTTSLMCYADDTTNGDNGIKILSTGGMVKRALESDSDKFIIGTETGLLYRLRKENPGKEFIPVREDAVCEFMKMITLEKVLESLRNEVYEVKVPEDTAIKAKKAIDRMLEITH